MKRSTDRILTTHVGSLIRPVDVLEGMMSKVLGEPVDEEAFQAAVAKGVADVVALYKGTKQNPELLERALRAPLFGGWKQGLREHRI